MSAPFVGSVGRGRGPSPGARDRRRRVPVALGGASGGELAGRFPGVRFVATNGGQINISGLGQTDVELALKACRTSPSRRRASIGRTSSRTSSSGSAPGASCFRAASRFSSRASRSFVRAGCTSAKRRAPCSGERDRPLRPLTSGHAPCRVRRARVRAAAAGRGGVWQRRLDTFELSQRDSGTTLQVAPDDEIVIARVQPDDRLQLARGGEEPEQRDPPAPREELRERVRRGRGGRRDLDVQGDQGGQGRARAELPPAVRAGERRRKFTVTIDVTA